MSNGYTTIQVNTETRKRLTKFKEYTRETYDEILNKLMTVVERLKSEGELTEGTKKAIEEGRKDIKSGRKYSTKELLRSLGVE